jgi:hypothetical protein
MSEPTSANAAAAEQARAETEAAINAYTAAPEAAEEAQL